MTLDTRAPNAPPPPGRTRFLSVTALPGNEFHPAVSPDGTRVAFAWAGPDPAHAEAADIHVRQLGSPATLALTHGGRQDWAPVWSPDGARVAFLRFDEGCQIMVVPASGGPADRLASCVDATSPRFAWSPDGRWLAATRREPGSTAAVSRLALIPVAGGDAQPLTLDPGEFRDTDPAFSPDGREVAFVRRWGASGGVGDVYTVPVAGGDPIRLTVDHAEVLGVAWIDGGRRIAFSSGRAGPFSLWAVPAAGGDAELLAGGGRKMKHPSASAAGDTVVYEAWDCEMNLYAQSASGAARPVAAASDQWTYDPHASPDGASIAFVSTRSGFPEIWVSRADGGEPRSLTSFQGPAVRQPRWSPDGRRLLFVARPAGRGEVWTVDAAGGPPRRLTDSPHDEAAPAWSADGARVLYSSRRAGSWQVLERRLDSGDERKVDGAGGLRALESPDGRWLYSTFVDRPGLWRSARTEGGRLGPAEVVTEALRPDDGASWGVVPAGVFWLEHAAELATVVLLRPGATRPERVASLSDLAWPGIDLTSDGRQVLYPRLDRNDGNLMAVSWANFGRAR